MSTLDKLRRLAEVEFVDIVKDTFLVTFKLRIILLDGSFIDVNLSKKLHDKFGFHWERKDKKGTIYRYDNFPDKNWESVSTFPYHFHNGSQENVEASPFPLTVIEGFRSFMEFVKSRVKG